MHLHLLRLHCLVLLSLLTLCSNRMHNCLLLLHFLSQYWLALRNQRMHYCLLFLHFLSLYLLTPRNHRMPLGLLTLHCPELLSLLTLCSQRMHNFRLTLHCLGFLNFYIQLLMCYLIFLLCNSLHLYTCCFLN